MVKLDKYKDIARYWQATRAGNGFYSLEHGTESYVVDLNEGSCTCKGWELSGISCPHSLAVMSEERLNPFTFVHDCCRTKYLRLTYQHTLVPINGENMWEQAIGVDVKPPVSPTKKKGSL